LKSTSLEINPLDLYFQAGFAVSERMTIGPSVSMLRLGLGFLSDVTIRGYTAGLQSTFYLSSSRFKDGWIFSPSAGYYSYEVTESVPAFFNFGPPVPPSTYYGKTHGFYGGFVAGYQWSWDDLVIFSLGGGATFYSQSRDLVLGGTGGTPGNFIERSLYGGVNPALLLNLGFIL
jgi:hypothetical protein